MTQRQRVQRVGIVAKRKSREAVSTARELTDWLLRRGLEVDVDEGIAGSGEMGEASTYEPGGEHDLVVVLGGDGTLLSVARNLSDGTPLLGVNLGRLGFLTEIGRAELYPALVEVLAGRFAVEARTLLDVHLRRAEGGEERFRVLNDVVVAKSALARIIELTVRVDERLVASYRSDGFIISTPTGSTAYNMSAGGAIVAPTLPVILLTPICPHTFSLRPIIVPETSRVDVTLETPQEEVYLTLDGQEGTILAFHDTVSIVRSPDRVRLIKLSGRSFYDNLRDKLGWGT